MCAVAHVRARARRYAMIVGTTLGRGAMMVLGNSIFVVVAVTHVVAAASSPRQGQGDERGPRPACQRGGAAAAQHARIRVRGQQPPPGTRRRARTRAGMPALGGAASDTDAPGRVPAFYKGLTLKLLRAVPASAAGFFVYEYVMAVIARQRARLANRQ